MQGNKRRNVSPDPIPIHHRVPADTILLLGPTGAGKSPLGDAIAQNGLFGRRCHHLDFGSELRGIVTLGDRSAAYSPEELDYISGVLEKGLLLENEHFVLAKKIIALFLSRVVFSWKELLVLNGLPRHAGQARDSADLFRMHAVCVLDCTANTVMRRIQNNAGGDRTKRSDDTKTLIENKLDVFRERTAPLIEHYKQQGCRVYRIPVSDVMTPADAYLHLTSLAAADPPVTLVAEPPKR